MDIHYIVTRLVNPRLNRAAALLLREGLGSPSPKGEALKRLAQRLEWWRDWLARRPAWNREVCREALDRLRHILYDIEELQGRGEAYTLLAEMAVELEKTVGLEGYLEGGEKGGAEKPQATTEKRGEAPELTVHYMVTRIINPRLNRLVSELRGSRGLAGRDGYTRVRWSTFTDGDHIAALLEIWVDDVWRKFRDEDLPERGGELLDSLLRVAAEAEARMGRNRVVEEIWSLARELESYLGLDGYLDSVEPAYRALVKAKVEERRRIEEALRRPQRRSRRRPRSPVPSLHRVPRRGRAGTALRGKRSPAKAALAILTLLLAAYLALLYLPAQAQQERWPTLPLSSCSQTRYSSLPSALRCYLARPEEAALLKSLANRLRGRGPAESAWNLLAWEEKHIAYDWGRRDALNTGSAQYIQPPSVTVRRGRGVCVDYAVLTAGVLAYMGYPAYVFEIKFYGTDVGHAAAAVKINGRFYMLDQKLPPLPLPAYYDYWAYYRAGTYEGHTLENLRIKEATVYKVYLDGGHIRVDETAHLSASQFRAAPHKASPRELDALAGKILERLTQDFPHLTVDPSLAANSEATVWSVKLPMLAEEYDPIFADGYAQQLYSLLSSAKGFRTAMLSYRRVWAGFSVDGDDATLKVYLAP